MVPVDGREVSEGSSKLNPVEAQAVERVVTDLLRGRRGYSLRPSDVGVITPYAAQASALKRTLGRQGVEVASVDGFQGREKEVIVFSCVRANAHGGLGFLADARRVNVAFTRARRGLIVLGHVTTLEADTHTWARWLAWARAAGAVCG